MDEKRQNIHEERTRPRINSLRPLDLESLNSGLVGGELEISYPCIALTDLAFQSLHSLLGFSREPPFARSWFFVCFLWRLFFRLGIPQ